MPTLDGIIILDAGAASSLLRSAGRDGLDFLLKEGRQVVITPQILGELYNNPEKYPRQEVFADWFDDKLSSGQIIYPAIVISDEDRTRYNPTNKNNQDGDISIKKFLEINANDGNRYNVLSDDGDLIRYDGPGNYESSKSTFGFFKQELNSGRIDGHTYNSLIYGDSQKGYAGLLESGRVGQIGDQYYTGENKYYSRHDATRIGTETQKQKFSDKIADTIRDLSVDERGSLNIDSIDDFARGIVDNLAKAVDRIGQSNFNLRDTLLAGGISIGGLSIGDFAEYAYYSYDSFKQGLQTGDWSDFWQNTETFGISMAVSSIGLAVATTAIGILFGAQVATAFAVGVAALELIEGVAATATLLGKIGSDLADVLGDLNLDELAAQVAREILNGIVRLLDPLDLGLDEVLKDLLGDLLDESESPLMDLLDLFLNPLPLDPLVIDLDGDGVELVDAMSAQAEFDLDGDGVAERVGWVHPDDALLAMDANGNGVIDGISELFGDASTAGFTELATLDSNGDGVIDAADAQFGELLLWQDRDGDGQADPGEVESAADRGLISISLDTSAVGRMVNGSWVSQRSVATWQDEAATTVDEVHFAARQVLSNHWRGADVTLTEAACDLPWLRGFGDIPDLTLAVSARPELANQVQTPMQSAANWDWAGFLDDFEAMLLDWAGVSDAKWVDEAGFVDVYFAREKAAGGGSDPDGLSEYNPDGDVKGYIFVPHTSTPNDVEGLEAFLERHNAAITDMVMADVGQPPPGVRLLDGQIAPDWSYSGQTWWGGILDITPDPEPEPIGGGLPATHFAFLQTLMGQSYRDAGNFLTPDDLIVLTLTPEEAADLSWMYEVARDSMAARFLVQAGESLKEQLGQDAEIGALAAFEAVDYDPLGDRIIGDVDAMGRKFIELFRTTGSGSDAEALDVLKLFRHDFKALGYHLADAFEDLDLALVQQAFGINAVVQGGTNEALTAPAGSQLVLGRAGNDTLTGNDGAQGLYGGAGDDLIFGGTVPT